MVERIAWVTSNVNPSSPEFQSTAAWSSIAGHSDPVRLTTMARIKPTIAVFGTCATPRYTWPTPKINEASNTAAIGLTQADRYQVRNPR